jgi:hypothetical protein
MRRWDESLWLITPAEFAELPDGTVLESISHTTVEKGNDYIDQDVRFGHLAFGVRDPYSHPQAIYFTKFLVAQE